MRNNQLPVNISNINNDRKSKIKLAPRLIINKKGGPLIHMKIDDKNSNDLFLLEDEHRNSILSIDCKGNIKRPDAEIFTTNEGDTAQREIEENIHEETVRREEIDFDKGIVMGCWRMTPTEESLLIQKNVNGEWITKHLLK
jgi:hypothetical protein